MYVVYTLTGTPRCTKLSNSISKYIYFSTKHKSDGESSSSSAYINVLIAGAQAFLMDYK
jgi:hypothetical protein